MIWALWYALNRLMINYWARTWIATAVARRTSFICRMRSYAVGNNRFEGEQKDPRLLCSAPGSEAEPQRVTW